MTNTDKTLGVLAATLLVVFAVQAAFMHGLLVHDADPHFHQLNPADGYVYLALLVLVLTGIVPALILMRLRIRRLLAYLSSGFLSGLLATYCAVNLLGTMFNAGAILHHSDSPNGLPYIAPTYIEVLGDTFRVAWLLILQIPDDLQHLRESAVILGPRLMAVIFVPAVVGTILGAIYWRFFVRRTLKRQETA